MTTSALIQWEVEALLSDSVIRGMTRYEVKWVGYEATTFEQIKNLNNCSDTVQAYLRKKSLLMPLTQDNLLAFDSNWLQPTVELVLGDRMNNEVQEYLVKWQGDEVLSWEPMTNLDNYLDLIFDYLFININQQSQEEISQHDFTEMGYDAAQALLNQNQNELIAPMLDTLNPIGVSNQNDGPLTNASFNNSAANESTQLTSILDESNFDELNSLNDQEVCYIFERIANHVDVIQLDTDIDLGMDMDVEQITDLLVNLSNARYF